jgi:hypothetical protein
MNPTDLLAAAVSLITGDPDGVGLIDRASVVTRSEAPDGFGGTTITEATALSNIPCLYEERTGNTQQVAGSPMSYITHDLYLIASTTTRNIAPSSKIVVAVRGSMPQQTFEQPLRLEETFGPIVHVGAKLKL